MSIWSKLASSGKTYGLVDLSKKRRKKDYKWKAVKKILGLKKKKNIISEGEAVQRDFDIMLKSELLDENEKKFLLSLKGNYFQFKRFTPKQFNGFKSVWWRMKARGKKEKLDGNRRVLK